jgi:hypothetical protein
MPNKHQPTPEEVAMLTLHLIEAHQTDDTWDYARISRETLRRISLRVRLEEEGFIDKWIGELAYFGWSVFSIGDEFGLMRSNVVREAWPRLASSPIRNTLAELRRGDTSTLDELREQFLGMLEPEEDE